MVCSQSTLTWPNLLQLSLTEHLEALKALKLLTGQDSESREKEAYVSFMIAFFRLDLQKMKQVASLDQDLPEWMKLLFELRILIREDLDLAHLRQVESRFNETELEDYQKGEILYNLGVAYHALRCFPQAEDHFVKASAYLDKAQAIKKSLRALMSSLASYSCASPETRLFFEYSALCRKALDHQDYQTAATCLVNISREYQRLELLQSALESIEEARQLFEDHAFGSREHALALVHRAHLLFQLNRNREALRELDIAIMNRHPEVQSSIKSLAEMFKVESRAEASDQVLPTWEERKDEEPNTRTLGRLESMVIKLLSQGPMTRLELADKVYGANIGANYTEARVKNLLVRIRKRFPGLIYFDGERYFITDSETESLKSLRRRIHPS